MGNRPVYGSPACVADPRKLRIEVADADAGGDGACSGNGGKPLAEQAVQYRAGHGYGERSSRDGSRLGLDRPRPQHPPRPGDILHSQADIAKAEKFFGWKPVINFPEGIAKTVAWYQRQG